MNRKLLRIEAIIFDFDDCLFATLEDRVSNTVRTLHENGYPSVTFEKARSVIGLDTAERMQKTVGIDDPEEGERLAGLWEETNRRVGYPNAAPFPQVLETLERIRQIPLGIFSASLAEAIEGVLECYGVHHRFRSIVGREDAPPKPSPEGLLRIATEFGIEPSKILFVGDTPKDIRTGKAAGMRTAAVLHGLGNEKDLNREQPDMMLQSFSQLVKLLETEPKDTSERPT